MKLELFERSVYGRRAVYPTGELGPYVQRLTRRTTLDHRDLDALVELGFIIEWVRDPSNQYNN
jgi:hypothetical protein